MPVIFLLLFVYVFGGTLGAGLGYPTGGRAASSSTSRPYQRPVRRRPFGAQPGHRIIGPVLDGRGALPQRETRLGLGEGRRMVAAPGALCAGRRPDQHGRGVDLVPVRRSLASSASKLRSRGAVMS
jgi:hypothetical protein